MTTGLALTLGVNLVTNVQWLRQPMTDSLD